MRQRIPLLLVFFAMFGFAWSKDLATPRDRLIVETLVRLERFDVSANDKWKGAVERYARSQRGEEGYFDLVEQFSIKGELPELLRLVEKDPRSAHSAKSVQLIFLFGEQGKLSVLLSGASSKKADAIVSLIGFVKTPQSENFLVQYNALKDPAKTTGKDAPALLSTPEDIDALARRAGNAELGEAVFLKFCFACHKAGDIGIDFGPGLSEIGDKLPKSELILAIVKPNAGISFDYEGWTIKTKQGGVLAGVVSQGDKELLVRMAGGVVQKVKNNDVVERTKMKASLMPEGMHLAMSEKDLVDLVEFLSSLRKK